MKIKAAIALAALAILGNGAPERPLDSIEFRISSWGKPLSVWRVGADGKALATRSEGPGMGSYRLITTRFDIGVEGFSRLRALLAAAERIAGSDPDCGGRSTDFPYGEVVWSGGGERAALSFDLGCHNPAFGPVHKALGDADTQMESWGKQGEVIENKEGHS